MMCKNEINSTQLNSKNSNLNVRATPEHLVSPVPHPSTRRTLLAQLVSGGPGKTKLDEMKHRLVGTICRLVPIVVS